MAAAGLGDNNTFTGNNTFNNPVVVPNAVAGTEAIPKGQADTLYTPVAVGGTARNSKVSALGLNNYNAVVTADEVILENSTGNYYVAKAVNKTINANGTVGAPLSIMSARAPGTFYFIWLWYNAGNGLTATLDASPTAPTAPTGYAATDYKAKLKGAVHTDTSGSTYLMQTLTVGDVTQYVVTAGTNTPNMPIMASGVAGNVATPTWVAVAIAAFVPTQTAAASTCVIANNSQNSVIMVAPNSSYGSAFSLTNPPALVIDSGPSTGAVEKADILLESTNIYWASSGGAVACAGWRDAF
jgi:hypothetical protein